MTETKYRNEAENPHNDAMVTKAVDPSNSEIYRPHSGQSASFPPKKSFLFFPIIAILLVAFPVGIWLFSITYEAIDQCRLLADSFMTSMAVEKVNEAYSLFSSEAKQEVTIEDLQSTRNGPTSILFEDYAGLGIDSFYFNFNNIDGLSLELSGPIHYQDNTMGAYQAIFLKPGGEWRIYYYRSNSPPEKLGNQPNKAVTKSANTIRFNRHDYFK